VRRERLEWVAGLRTHMLICLGSALVMIVSAYGFNDVISAYRIVLDPSRVAAQVVSGIGFLGAGTILFLRQQVSLQQIELEIESTGSPVSQITLKRGDTALEDYVEFALTRTAPKISVLALAARLQALTGVISVSV
jgi:hypothetical protein